MSVQEIIMLLLVGLVAGILAGGLGIGGGIVIVPALVLLFGFTQHQAQGTSLAVLLFPVVSLGVWNYFKAGYVNFKFVFIIVFAFLIGSFLGSYISVQLDPKVLKRIFGFFLLLVSIKMIFNK
jgi:uncharacterized protein